MSIAFLVSHEARFLLSTPVSGPPCSEIPRESDIVTSAPSSPFGELTTVTDLKQALRPGAILAGKYRIQGLIGKGGMGAVYEASHLLLGARVAIKVRRDVPQDEQSSRDPRSVTRLLNEARALASLENEHVARVTDAGLLSSGEPYIVMEYLEGEDLAAVLARRTRLAPSEAVDYVLQALEGLAEAHGRGIVHRDIKPSNLFLARVRRGREVVKVLDFGISKVEQHLDRPSAGATSGASVLGTPAYMSPEQIRSPKQVDARTDIWAIGVVLYELIAGNRPFIADSLGEMFSAVLEQRPPSLGDVVPECSRSLTGAISRCFQVSPDARFSDVAGLADALGGEVADGPARVDRIRAALQASTSIRAASARNELDRGAVTNTLQVLPEAVEQIGPPVVETRSAWGAAPVPDSRRRSSERAATRRWWIRGAVVFAVVAFASVLVVAGSRPKEQSAERTADLLKNPPMSRTSAPSSATLTPQEAELTGSSLGSTAASASATSPTPGPPPSAVHTTPTPLKHRARSATVASPLPVQSAMTATAPSAITPSASSPIPPREKQETNEAQELDVLQRQ